MVASLLQPLNNVIKILIQAIDFLNPEQVALARFYQSLHVLAKKIQWDQSTLYGRKNSYLCLVLSISRW